MCKWGTYRLLRVPIPADLSATGKERWVEKPIDRCIAPLVEALNAAGIFTRASCCGHGRQDGEIVLQDGRILVIKQHGGWVMNDDDDLLVEQALSMYADEPCRICGRTLKMTDLRRGAVFTGYSQDNTSRAAHRRCWDGFVEMLRIFIPDADVGELVEQEFQRRRAALAASKEEQ